MRWIRLFEEVSLKDIGLVGGKNASLGELIRELSQKGINVPRGFVITSEAFRYFIESAKLEPMIRDCLGKFDPKKIPQLQKAGHEIRDKIIKSPLPKDLEKEIIASYEELGHDISVAVRSSATAEDLPGASFAGQQETFLNVKGSVALLEFCRKCFASLFTDRAISYRFHKGFDHTKVALSIGVQQLVRSDLGTSGVMFSIDTETGFQNVVLITGSYGLGENIVQGTVSPDEFFVFKPTLFKGFKPILHRSLGTKEFKLVLEEGEIKTVKNVPVSISDRSRFCMNDDEVLQLATWACIIEDHYTQKHGVYTPMDIEWAKDGVTGVLFIVQARPETVQARKRLDTLETYKLKKRGNILIEGKSVGEKIVSGKVRLLLNPSHLSQVQKGDIIVTEKTDPDWEPVMKIAAGIITDHGGRTCHAAIVSRELGLPAIVGTQNGTKNLKEGQEVTLSCAEGDNGFVYEGILEFEKKSVILSDLPNPKTKIMMNVADPESAFRLSFIPNSGVGLAREEFIVTHFIKIHPMALLNFEQLKNIKIIQEIDQLTRGYSSRINYYVEKLAEGIAMIAAAFYPKDVILRFSDFKTNEYKNLIGGETFEPNEENPMIGFRGASRYYDPNYNKSFHLECEAIKKVRHTMGLTNLKVMIPFCRTIEEGKRVLKEMESAGLKQGDGGLEVYVMCEIPSNVILAEEFLSIFDGFSIGSNDLTQLTLGVDRDSEIVAHVFDERNEAVKKLIAQAIQAAKKMKKKIGICGQAPSDYPEFAAFLVEQGIDSISLNPDSVIRTLPKILEVEKRFSIGDLKI